MLGTEHALALPPGHVVGGYRLGRVLGQGSFGIVYKGEDVHLGRAVAIKEYLPVDLATRDGAAVRPISARHAAAFEEYKSGFLAEARRLAGFKHANIVHCLSYTEANNTAYLIMEYEDGLSLSDLFRKRKADGEPLLSGPQILQIVLPILDGLDAAHARGVLHRDIKPSNIFIRRSDEQPVLIDFGAAKEGYDEHSKSTHQVRTPGYAPMEQVERDGRLGPWTDIYALGATLRWIITGQTPPPAEERAIAVARKRRDPLDEVCRPIPRNREFPDHWLGVVDKCMALFEEDRYQTVAELRKALTKKPSYTLNVSPGKLVLRPDIFQFRHNADPVTGRTGRLDGIKQWNNMCDTDILAYRFGENNPYGIAAGNIVVIDGYERVNRAMEIKTYDDGAPITFDVHIIDSGEMSPQEAKIEGASVNHAKFGYGPMDIALVLRSMTGDVRSNCHTVFIKNNISRYHDGRVEIGCGLAALGKGAFKVVMDNWYDINPDHNPHANSWSREMAAAVGSGVPASTPHCEKIHEMLLRHWIIDGKMPNSMGCALRVIDAIRVDMQGQKQRSFSFGIDRETAENEVPLTAGNWREPADAHIDGLVHHYTLVEKCYDEESHEATAQYRIGEAYGDGEDAPRNPAEAAKWFLLAAEQGHHLAQCAIGDAYHTGEGVPQSDTEALKWWRLAALRDYVSGQVNLAGMYQLGGRGVQKNYAEAVKWWRKVAVWGEAASANGIDFGLGKEMTSLASSALKKMCEDGYRPACRPLPRAVDSNRSEFPYGGGFPPYPWEDD